MPDSGVPSGQSATAVYEAERDVTHALVLRAFIDAGLSIVGMRALEEATGLEPAALRGALRALTNRDVLTRYPLRGRLAAEHGSPAWGLSMAARHTARLLGETDG